MRLLSIALLACSCAQAYPLEEPGSPPPQIDRETKSTYEQAFDVYSTMIVDGVPPINGRDCSLPLDVPASLVQTFNEELPRWRAITGCDVYIAAGGVPVFHQEVPEDKCVAPEGFRSVGCTIIKRREGMPEVWWLYGLYIAPGNAAQEHIRVAHEMGHALGLAHTHDGLMADGATTVRITDSVCSAVEKAHSNEVSDCTPF